VPLGVSGRVSGASSAHGQEAEGRGEACGYAGSEPVQVARSGLRRMQERVAKRCGCRHNAQARESVGVGQRWEGA
jgi:hypothetical protein